MKITISGCTVHAYDPSTQVKMNSDAAKYPNLHYHKIGIGKANAQFLKNNAKILYGTKICTIEPQISSKRTSKYDAESCNFLRYSYKKWALYSNEVRLLNVCVFALL